MTNWLLSGVRASSTNYEFICQLTAIRSFTKKSAYFARKSIAMFGLLTVPFTQTKLLHCRSALAITRARRTQAMPEAFLIGPHRCHATQQVWVSRLLGASPCSRSFSKARRIVNAKKLNQTFGRWSDLPQGKIAWGTGLPIGQSFQRGWRQQNQCARWLNLFGEKSQ